MTGSPPIRPLTVFDRVDQGAPWTINDLGGLPAGHRYEIFDGTLLGIPQYWIVDQEARTLTLLRLDAKTQRYVESAVVRAGEVWKTDDPYPLRFDPAEFV